jgi:hypothetical protein
MTGGERQVGVGEDGECRVHTNKELKAGGGEVSVGERMIDKNSLVKFNTKWTKHRL